MRTTALAAVLLACATLPASAETVSCMTRDQITDNLVNRHGESRQAWKLDGSGLVLEFWAAPGGTWTLITTSPLGVSCVLKVGDGAVLPVPVVEEAL